MPARPSRNANRAPSHAGAQSAANAKIKGEGPVSSPKPTKVIPAAKQRVGSARGR